MRAHAHHPQQRDAPGKREREDVSSGETGEHPLRRAQTFPGRLRTGQLRARFVEHRAPLREQLRILTLPHVEVGTAVEDGHGPIADVRVEATELRLRDGERDHRDGPGLLQICLELFQRQPRRGSILDAVFQQLSVVTADIARLVVCKEVRSPRSHGLLLSMPALFSGQAQWPAFAAPHHECEQRCPSG